MSDKTVSRIVINGAKILLKFVFNKNMLSAYKHSMHLCYILRIQEEMKIVKKYIKVWELQYKYVQSKHLSWAVKRSWKEWDVL